MPLNLKQQAFVREYVVDLNATQAAIRAGYSEKTAGAIGHELLQKPEIQACVEEELAAKRERANLTADHVLAMLLDSARNCVQESAKVRAQELIAKHLGMFTKRIEMKHDLSKLTDEELQQLDAIKQKVGAAPVK